MGVAAEITNDCQSNPLERRQYEDERNCLYPTHLEVVVVRAMEQTVDVPAHMRPHIISERELDQIISLCLLFKAVEDQSFHRLRLTVIRELLENLVCGLTGWRWT